MKSKSTSLKNLKKIDFSIDTLVYPVLKEPNIDTQVALKQLKEWIQAYDFELILERLFTHFQAYAQSIPVKYINQDGTCGQWDDAFPGELLDGITRVCIGQGDHKKRIQLLTQGLIKWYSEVDTYLLTEPFIKEVTGYLLSQIDALIQFYHSIQTNLLDKPVELDNHAAFVYYLLKDIIELIQHRKPLKLKVFELLDRILESLPSLPASMFVELHRSETPLHVWSIQQMMSADWLWEHTLPLAALFKDLTLDEDLIELILPRFIRQMPLASPEDLPMLTYHVLLITKKIQTPSKKRQVFLAISEYFNHLNDMASKDSTKQTQLMVKESSTLLHMCTAIAQDNTLGNDYFAFVKSLKRRQITSFNISLMLSMTKIKLYKEPILSHLKKEVEAVVKLRSEIEQFHWLKDASPFSVPDMFSIFLNVLQKTAQNWEILDGLIALACSFLSNSTGVTLPWWQSVKNNYIQGYSIPSSLTTYRFPAPLVSFEEKKELQMLSINDLGLLILTHLFEMHELVRETILDILVAQITSKSSAVSSYIYLLRLLFTPSSSSSTPHTTSGLSFILNRVRTLELLLDQVQHLSIAHACSLLHVLVDLTQWHAGFRNTVMLFLRKSMVNKRSDLREVSIHGGLCLFQLAHISKIDDSFLYEIVGVLRRCFQFTQSDLKLIFYVQLAYLLETYPGLGIYIIEPLETALAPYITASSQLALDACLETGTIKEPLHWLMKCVVLAHGTPTTVNSSSTSTSFSTNTFQTQWSCMASKLYQMDFLELFPTGICFGLTPDCLPHLSRSLLYLGCLEAVFEYLFLFPSSSSPNLDSFYEKRDQMAKYIQRNFIDAKGRKGSSSPLLQSIFDSAPFFSISTLVYMIPTQPSLLKPLLTQLTLVVQQHTEYPWELETALTTSKLLLSAITREQMELQTEQLRRDPKSFRFLLSVLTSFKSIYLKAIQSSWSLAYLKALPPFDHLFHLAKDLLLYPLAKEAILLFQLLLQAPLPKLDTQRELQQVVLTLVCSTSSFTEDIIVKPLFQLLFHLSKQMTGMLVFVARNILYRWGKITTQNATENSAGTDDIHLSPEEILDCLEPYKSQLQAASALCEEIELCITEIDRCLAEFKSEYGRKDVEIPSSIQGLLPQFDKMLCDRFSIILHAVLLLSQSTVKPELTLSFLKMLTHTFSTLNGYLQFKDKWISNLEDSLNIVKLGSQLHETLALLQLAMDQTVVSRHLKNTTLQAKAMATLILHVEQFDILVIRLAKKFKPLSRFIKRSIVRDFRFETHRISVDEKEKGHKKKGEAKGTEGNELVEKKNESQRKRRKLSTF